MVAEKLVYLYSMNSPFSQNRVISLSMKEYNLVYKERWYRGIVVLLVVSLFLLERSIMNHHIDYLLKYISNDTYQKIITKKDSTVLENLENDRVDVDLNIRYLIKQDIKNIDTVVYNWLDELLLPHNELISLVDNYIKKLGKEGFINMLETV